MTESSVSYVCEIWAVDYRLKTKLLSAGTDIWKRAARTSIIGSKILIKSKNGSDSVLKRMENNGLKMALTYYAWEVTDGQNEC